jgi:protein arginine N-methyltransferase 2
MIKFISAQIQLGLHYYNMAYIEKELVFQESKIYFADATSPTGEKAVMMDWEDPIMYASAQYVAENGGNILEIGYGMGISANYIQSFRPTSHTVVEIHPEIASQAKKWASKVDGVTILQGDWFNLKKEIEANAPYDGIFYDAYGDENEQKLVDFCISILNKGGRFTLWNPLPYPFREQKKVTNEQITYDIIDLSNVYIPDNDYFTHNVYYLPKIQL